MYTDAQLVASLESVPSMREAVLKEQVFVMLLFLVFGYDVKGRDVSRHEVGPIARHDRDAAFPNSIRMTVKAR
jgi:hypothetical protein